MNQDLNEIDSGLPLGTSTNVSLAADIRNFKETFKNVILTTHNSDGTNKSAADGGAATIGDDTVSTSSIQDLAITSIKLEDLSVTEAKLANQAVGSGKYKDASIPSTAFTDASIVPARLSGQLTGAQIGSSASVDASRAISTDHIKDAAITDAKVTSIGPDKISGGSAGEVLLHNGTSYAGATFGGDITYDSGTGLFSVLTGLKVAVVGDHKSTGTGGGTATAAGWKTRDLGEISDLDNIIAFSGNSFSLLEGTYFLYLTAPASGIGAHQTRLILNDGINPESAVLWGSSTSSVSTGSQTESILAGGFVVGDASDLYRLEHYTATTAASANELGVPTNASGGMAGQTEVYTKGFIVKLA